MGKGTNTHKHLIHKFYNNLLFRFSIFLIRFLLLFVSVIVFSVTSDVVSVSTVLSRYDLFTVQHYGGGTITPYSTLLLCPFCPDLIYIAGVTFFAVMKYFNFVTLFRRFFYCVFYFSFHLFYILHCIDYVLTYV